MGWSGRGGGGNVKAHKATIQITETDLPTLGETGIPVAGPPPTGSLWVPLRGRVRLVSGQWPKTLARPYNAGSNDYTAVMSLFYAESDDTWWGAGLETSQYELYLRFHPQGGNYDPDGTILLLAGGRWWWLTHPPTDSPTSLVVGAGSNWPVTQKQAVTLELDFHWLEVPA